jgi:membrane protein DedA with SNARE-associated domain
MRRGITFVMLYHFAGYTRLVGPGGAGLLRMPYRRWAPADHFGAVLWVGSHVAAGYGLGRAGVRFDSIDKYFKVIEWALLALVVLWFLYLYHAGWPKLRRHFLTGSGGDISEEPVSVRSPD